MSHWLRILHISDLHERVALDDMSDERKAKVRGGKASRYRVLGSNLNEVLEEIRKEHAINLVCFTGDVADWGLAEEYKQATSRLDSILSAAGVSRDRLFLVPGNHDVNRKLAVDAWTEMWKLADAQLDLSRWMAGEGSPYGVQSDWREDILKRTAAFWQWVDKDLALGVLKPENNPHRRLGYCVPVRSLGLSFPLYIVGLDSAWLAGDERVAGKPLLTQRQIDLLTTDEEGKRLPGLRLALVHHPLTSLSDYRDSFNLLADSVDLLLHGHQHEEAVEEQLNPDRRLYVFAAGSLYEGAEEDKYINSFHVLDILTTDEGRPLRFDFQFWGWAKGGYWYPTGAIYKAARDGRYTLLTNLGKKVRPPPDQKVRIAPDHLLAPYRNPASLDADFKDRVEQRNNTVQLLGDDSKRLICIFGRPGMGKTCLAAKVLWDIENSCRAATNSQLNWDGIVYLPIEDLTFDNLFDRIRDVCSDDAQKHLDAVRRSNVDIARKIEKLMDVLNKGRYIILMDGIETLLDREGKFDTEQGKARDLSQFCKRALESASESKIVLTSTKSLALDEAALYPRTHQEELSVGLPKKDAIARLRELDPPGSRMLKNASDEQLAGIVKATYGIPRALELVAHILSQKKNWRLTLDDIAARFFQFVEVVDTLVEETYKGLDSGARRIVEALAVFGRPVRIEAVCFVLRRPPKDKKIDKTITRLAETHLVNLDLDVEASLFSLHPIDQSYTYCRIPENGGGHNRKELHSRAASYYAGKRKPREEWKEVINDIEPQLLEFDQRVKAEDYDGAAQVMDTIDYSWINHHKYLAYLMYLGYGSDSIKRREELLGKLSSKLEVHNRTSLGWVCRRMGRKKEAEEHLAIAVKQARAGDDAGARIYALSELGYFLTDNAGKHDEADTCLSEALKIARAIGDDYSQAHSFLGLAFADFQRPERNASSLKNASQALELFQKVPTQCARYREIDCWVRLGMIHRKTEDYQAAVLTAEKGLEVADTHGLVGWKGELNSGLGFHLRAQGKFEAAIKCHKEALSYFGQQCGMKREEAVQYSYLGNLYIDLGLLDDAQGSYQKAEDIAKATDLRRELSWILANRGVLYCRLGDYEKAYTLQHQALTIVKENNHLDSQVVRFTDLSATLQAMGKQKEAGEAILNALRCAAQDGKINLTSRLPEAYLKMQYLEDKLPHEMQSPHDHLRRGTTLARIYLHSNDLAQALQVIEYTQSRQRELNPHKHLLTVLYAIVVHRFGQFEEARMTYQRAVEDANDIQSRAPQYYPAQYTHGLALAGLAILSKDHARDTLVEQAREAYQKALDMCKAAGVVNDAKSLLREIPSEYELISLVLPKDYNFSK